MTNGRSIFLYERQTRMAGTILGNVATGASSWVSWISAMEKTRKGFLAVSLTNPATTAASSIATGSVMELSGSFYTFTETAITLASGTASASVAFYFTVIPSAGGTTCTVVMDDTIPTWVDSKQGYYASAASLTRFIGGARVGTAGVYYDKYIWQGGYPHKISFLHIQDEKTVGTEGGAATAGVWQTRTLNTIKTNEMPGASLSSNQFILPAGTYYIEWSAPAVQIGGHHTKLRNITESVDVLIGSTEVNDVSIANQTRSFGNGRFTIAIAITFEIQHRVSTSRATFGFGTGAGFATEIYTIVKIEKVA